MANASLQPIYNRLNGVADYKPLSANTFTDWAMEAGDIVRVVRGNEQYDVPVHNTSLVWKGSQQMTIESTGNKERDSIARMSARKYGRGGAALRSSNNIYMHFESEDQKLRSDLEMTESRLRVEFTDEVNSLHSELEMTASHLRTEFTDADAQLQSELELTASHLRTEFTDADAALRSELELTASHLRTEFRDADAALESELEITASHLRADFEAADGRLESELELTASHLRTEFTNADERLQSEFELTASHLRTEFTDADAALESEFEATASGMRIEYTNGIASAHAAVQVQANRISLVVDGSGTNAKIKAAQIVAAINDDGTSQTLISADKILLDGNAVLSGYLHVSNGTLIADEGIVTDYVGIYAGGKIRFNGAAYGQSWDLDSANLVGLIKNMKIELSGNTYTLYKQVFSQGSDEWTQVGTFSRATSLDGVWSGGKLTVTADPQGETFERTLVQKAAVWAADNKSVTVPIYAQWGSSGQYEQDTERTVYVDALPAYNAGVSDGSTAGYNSAHISKEWGSGADSNKVVLSKTTTGNTNTYTLTVTADAGISYNSSTHKYTATANANCDDATRDTDSETSGTEAYDAGSTAGYNSAHVSKTWGSGSDSNKVVLAKTTSGSTNSYTLTVTADAGISYNSTTHKYTASANANCDGATRDTDSETSGTEAYDAGRTAVTLNDPTWQATAPNSASYNTISVSTNGRATQLTKSTTLYLTQGSWSSNKMTVSMRAGSNSGSIYAQTTVDASTLVTNAGYAGRAAVTLNDPTWNAVTTVGSSRTISVTTSGRTDSSGTTSNLTKSATLYLTQGSWSNNTLDVSMRTGSTSGVVYAKTTVDASTLVSDATTAGKNAVTLNNPTWEHAATYTSYVNKISVTTNGRPTQLTKSVTLYLTQGNWTNNKVVVSLRDGGLSGSIYAQTTVDASTYISSATHAGSAAVGLADPTWNSVSSVGTYRTVSVATTGRTDANGTTSNLTRSSTLYLTQGSWNSSNQLTVAMRDGSTTGTIRAQTTVDAGTLVSTAKASGWTSCYNSVGISPTTSQSLSPGGSVTVYAQAYQSSSATAKTNVASVTVSANTDANLVAGNIKDGVTIFGVTGTYSGGSGGSWSYQSSASSSSTEYTSYDKSYTLNKSYTWFRFWVQCGSSTKYIRIKLI